MDLCTGYEIDAHLQWPLGRSERLARNGKLPHFKLPDGSIRFDLAEVSALIRHVACPSSLKRNLPAGGGR
jgi:hypothetical protein